MIENVVQTAIELMKTVKVGAEPPSQLAEIAEAYPADYLKAVRKVSKSQGWGKVVDLSIKANQTKYLHPDGIPQFVKGSNQAKKVWRNYMLEHEVEVEAWERPNTLNKLVAAVARAGAAKKKIRAVGSGHSSSDASRPTDSALIEVDLLEKIDYHPALKAGLDPEIYCRVEAGSSIYHVNKHLRTRTSEAYPKGLALENMGSYDAQTIVGAACTGTHGSGLTLKPLSDSLASLVIVTLRRDRSGKLVPRILQIEPSDGITDPATFDPRTGGIKYEESFDPATNPRWELVQDDRMFNAAIVSMGCFGVVYAVTLKVRASYWIEETRLCVPWRKVKKTMLADAAKVRHYEILVCPYPTWQPDGSFDHTTLVSNRREVPFDAKTTPRVRNLGLASYADGFIMRWGAHDFAADVVSQLLIGSKTAQAALPSQIEGVVRLLQVRKYSSWASHILLLGAGNSMMAWSNEMAIPVSRCVAAIDTILALAADKYKNAKGFHTSPIGVRFVAASRGTLSPQGAWPGLPEGEATCMIETPILHTRKGGQMDILTDIQKALVPENRTHWGQLNTLDLPTIRKVYGDAAVDAWLSVFAELNVAQTFSNSFSKRNGFDAWLDAQETKASV